MNRLAINEIFYSIQGEGARVGTANVFIRTQGCSHKHGCLKFGVECDTEFESGQKMTTQEILGLIQTFPCQNIIWTGGEPAEQLTEEIVGFFKKKKYFQSIETSGVFPIPSNIDYISLSPKVSEHVLKKKIQGSVNELRYVIHSGNSIPRPSIKAEHYFLSPHFDGDAPNFDNINHCLKLCLENPMWRLSVQVHKFLYVR